MIHQVEAMANLWTAKQDLEQKQLQPDPYKQKEGSGREKNISNLSFNYANP